MFSSILNNPSTLPALHALSRAQSSMATSIQRLSTGLRINSAADDPAGLIAATHLSADLVSIQAKRQAEQMDYYKAMVADGSYSAVSDLLQNAQSLLLQSQAGPSAAIAGTDSLQSQMDDAFDGIDHIAATMSMDGSRLLAGTTTLGSPGTPPSGDDPGTPSTQITLKRTDTFTLGSYTDPNDPDHPTYTLADLSSGGALSISSPSANSSLTSDQRADLAQKVLSTAITQVASQRADVGSFMRYTVQSDTNVLDNEEENMSAALSQIQDADYATEVSNYVRQQSLIQSNTAVLAYGIQQSRQTLSLLTPITSQ
ncbi:MAG TPA: flagellin [Tepidisphaeraceae bacterium]|jgi:flagellin|nr:flagellin [Tepidisphaeraceae bacterium]